MSPSKKKDVALACHALVGSMFAMMHNPRFRGPNSKWEEFASWMGERCETELFIYLYPCTDEMKSYAKQCGSEIAARLVSRMKE
jgi:hypothetical protein